MTPRERYKLLTKRLNKVEAMRVQRQSPSFEADVSRSEQALDHTEWLITEKASLRMELRVLRDVMSDDGSIEY